MFGYVFAGIGRIVVTIDGGWPELEPGAALSGQFHKIYSGAPTGELRCFLLPRPGLAQTQKCAALASFIVDPWSRCDRSGPN